MNQNIMMDFKNLRVDATAMKGENQTDSCGCDCSSDGCSDNSDQGADKFNETQNDQHGEIRQIILTIDGKSIEVNPMDKNIVDVASRYKIGIPAPCYLAKRKNGCCNACVIEIDGQQKFACSTSPKDGMNITVNREDLKALRKDRIQQYMEAIRTGNTQPCCAPGK